MSIPKVVFELLQAVGDFLRASGSAAAEEEALMLAQEAIKREMDRRKFGAR